MTKSLALLTLALSLSLAFIPPVEAQSQRTMRQLHQPLSEASPAVVTRAIEALGEFAASGKVGAAGIVEPLACEINTLPACGTPTFGSLGGSDCLAGDYYVDFYRISGSSGDPVKVTVSSPGKMIFITLQRSSDGEVVAQQNGASPVTLSASLPFTGEFAIGIAFIERFGTGSYTMNVGCNSDGGSDCPSRGTLGCAGIISETLASSDCRAGGDYYADVFEFQGVKGRPVEVTVTASFKPFIEISDEGYSSGSFVQGSNPQTIVFVPSADGTHTIVVSSYDENTSGSYSVLLSCIPSNCRTRPVRRE